MSISLVIVEDDLEVLKGIKQMLNLSEELRVLDSFTSAESFMESIDELKPDVVLMDIGLPKMNGIECVEIVKQKYPDIQFLMCTNFDDDEKVFEALRAGANGYVLKNAEIQSIIQAISEVKRGGSPMSRSIARKVIESFHSVRLKEIKYNLSKRETEILNWLSKGYRYKEIAAKLYISTETVRTHIRNIYSKLQVQSRTEALNKFYNK
ncbi:MAG: response regulator transcription factor [Bacteroidetes bacterium]|mgnify:CR=1 FL=1|jgi:DNA-binding NarL/FixJ family response regulator|nr:response regulator transcription factor [Bacteroidota bacterium]MBT6686895.1 response regulator transcription factor [Bacteroidota bacterium]MBT7144207.1 response regulator transcription factor [Bacteroidota bacterium]MBT7491590.1 response regulator transcription factor [Bacteroidota bacterium]